jgi:hypothetical protein
MFTFTHLPLNVPNGINKPNELNDLNVPNILNEINQTDVTRCKQSLCNNFKYFIILVDKNRRNFYEGS